MKMSDHSSLRCREPKRQQLTVASQGEELICNGLKNFNTGGIVSDLTVLKDVLGGTGDHIFTFISTVQPGIHSLTTETASGSESSESIAIVPRMYGLRLQGH
jgi:hypothetical protein